MNRREYVSYTKSEFRNRFGYGKFDFRKKALEFFKPVIEEMKKARPGVEIHLHHIPCEYNEAHYEFWNPKYLRPLYKDEHDKIHKSVISEKCREACRLNRKGHITSMETRIKMSISHKGLKMPSRSEEYKEKQRFSHLGKKYGESTKKKLSDNTKGRVWYNNGMLCIRLKITDIVPEGFKRGRL